MELIRNFIDKWYVKNRDSLFAKTPDPEGAHEQFVATAQRIHQFRLERLLLDCPENKFTPGFEISNAAGFNKNGTIPPTFLRYIGFDRAVIGTVTYDAWEGNPRPRIKRYPDTNSMVNWMGLPGIGAKRVRDNLGSYGSHQVPLTINLMATPGKTGDALLKDIEQTVETTREVRYVDRFELNISCPNTHAAQGGDTRSEYQKQLKKMLDVVRATKFPRQELYLKVSPDLDRQEVCDIIETSAYAKVAGFVTTNTTTIYDSKFITERPNPEGRGGASGDALYFTSLRTQRQFEEYIYTCGLDMKIIACGGIKDIEKAERRMKSSLATGVQIFTPLIFSGPRIIRELRAMKQHT